MKTDWRRVICRLCFTEGDKHQSTKSNTFLKPIPSGLNLVVAAVLHDSLYVVLLLSYIADCFMLYIVCKVEGFVLTIIKRRLLLLLLLLLPSETHQITLEKCT